MDSNSEVVYLYLDDIIPNRFQPREIFDDQALKELAVSIKEHGVIQPIIVRKVEDKYEIIAGERRYKASTMAGLTKIPAIVKNLDDKESSKVALIENLQRKDLSPIEEARTYQKILELEDNMTQEELAATMGKTQSSVSNKLRLLELPEEIQDALLKEKISERHARSLLTIENKNDQIKMMDKVIAEKMTVRDLEKEIKVLKGEIEAPKPAVETVEQPQETPAPAAPINSFTPIGISSTTEESDSKPSTKDIWDSIEIPKPDLEAFVSAGDTSTTSTSTEMPTLSFDTTPTSSVDTTEPPESETKKREPLSKDLLGTEKFSLSDPLASEITTDTISVPANDINKAITNVKNTISDLKNNGFKVTFEESDDLNNYKISIQIDKN